MSVMESLRSKKRGFFTVSTNLTSLSDRKRNKGDNHGWTYVRSENSWPEEVTNDDQGSVTSEDNSTDQETPVSGSSCDDINKASRKLQTYAKKSIRRDKKKEKEKQERKEKNKLSMEDYLSKQIDFHVWLEEEKKKNPKEMSSPKRKSYFKIFLKLWNKRKLPQKYYKGSAELQSPCPSKSGRTFSFTEDDDGNNVVRFSRPKSKRLSIEPWGPPDSPFSTFGKTPPKLLHTSNLPLLDIKSPLALEDRMSVDMAVFSSEGQLPELGEYQTPKNAIHIPSDITQDRNQVTYEMISGRTSTVPNTSHESENEESPVYAVPWKPKPTPRKRNISYTKPSVKSPSPPPVPPKSFEQDPKDLIEFDCPSNDSALLKNSDNHSQHSEDSTDNLPSNCAQQVDTQCKDLGIYKNQSEMELDVSEQNCGRTHEGWQSPITAKPFSPPLKGMTTFFPPEKIYAEIEQFNTQITSDSAEVIEVIEGSEVSLSPESDVADSMVASDYTSSPESQVKHVVVENLPKQRATTFSFSKYLITPEKSSAQKKKTSAKSEDTNCKLSGKRFRNDTSQISTPEQCTLKPEKKSRKPPISQSNFSLTMKVCNGLHNIRNFVIGNEIKDSETRRYGCKTEQPLSSKKPWHSSEKSATLLQNHVNSMTTGKENYLETDIDCVPVPVIGCKTPPHKRKTFSNLQRSKSMETIIW